MATPRCIRVGWVFEGGGAKGSFSFAAALELLGARVPLDCLAGTSVGALTALLLSCGACAEGQALWRTLKRKDVLPFRKWKLFSIPYLTVLLFLHSYIWTFTGRRGWPDAGRIRRLLEGSALFLMLLPIWTFCITLAMHDSWMTKGLAIAIGLYFVFAVIVHTESSWPEQERRKLVGVAQSLVALSLVVVPALILADFVSRLLGSGSLALKIERLPVTYGFLCGLAFHLIAANAQSRSVLSSIPLRELVVGVLNKGPPKVPTYVTVAFESRHFDPDFPSIAASPRDPGNPPHYYPIQRAEFVPRYLRVDNLPLSRIADYVTASAALPFGLLNAVKIGSKEVIDGGVADNVPIRPLIDEQDCDVIIVFRLNSEPTPPSDDLISQHPDLQWHWKRSWRKENLATYIPDDDFKNRDWSNHQDPAEPVRIPWLALPRKWPELIIVQPTDQSLGGLLDFSDEMRAKREAWGKEAGERAVLEWHRIVTKLNQAS
jgi:predicted acylesterase/phospholipase RssA